MRRIYCFGGYLEAANRTFLSGRRERIEIFFFDIGNYRTTGFKEVLEYEYFLCVVGRNDKPVAVLGILIFLSISVTLLILAKGWRI